MIYGCVYEFCPTSNRKNILSSVYIYIYTRPRRGPQRPYIDDEIWTLRQRKLDHKGHLKHIRHLLRRETLARVFACWREPQFRAQEQSFCFGTTLRVGILKHGLAFRRLAAQLKDQIQANKSASLQAVIGQFSSATAASEIQQKLRPFMGSSQKLRQGLAPLPLIKDAQGKPCVSHTAALQRWIEFFSEMEGGERVDETKQRAYWRDSLKSLRTFILDIPITEMPSLTELEHTCRQVAAGKASGMDNIPAELIRYCPKIAARQLYSLLLKIAVQGQEPLEHKGGYLIPIWKVAMRFAPSSFPPWWARRFTRHCAPNRRICISASFTHSSWEGAKASPWFCVDIW